MDMKTLSPHRYPSRAYQQAEYGHSDIDAPTVKKHPIWIVE